MRCSGVACGNFHITLSLLRYKRIDGTSSPNERLSVILRAHKVPISSAHKCRLLDHLQEIMTELNANARLRKPCLSPTKFLTELCHRNSMFAHVTRSGASRQQDAHEFLIYLLDQLQGDLCGRMNEDLCSLRSITCYVEMTPWIWLF